MTAMMTGIKSSAGVIAVAPEVEPGNCQGASGNLPTLLEQAQEQGKATGIVTTTRITHATPAATYAHSPHRDWEGDADIPADMKACATDIASQLIDNGAIDVVMGGGRSYFMPATSADPEYPQKTGKRQDGRDLITIWKKANPQGQYIWNKGQFDAIGNDFKGAILGLFEPSHMNYEADRQAFKGDEPSLAEMTQKAIARLQQNNKGFFLMVEGGRIDHAHHAGNAYRALADGQEFARAVQMAVDNTNADDTLIIVTADHSHTITMAGYPTRGNPILGSVIGNDDHGHAKAAPELAADGKPYTTLGYANGVGYGRADHPDERYLQKPNPGRFLTEKETPTGKDFHQETLVPMPAETHGGEDVAIYARGPWSHLFHGVHEQNYIYQVMKYALWPTQLPKTDK
jgi:alkaline phosphatase